MRHKHSRSVTKRTEDSTFEKMGPDVSIDGRERVVQNDDVCAVLCGVNGPSEVDTRLLPPAQVDAPRSYFCAIATFQNFEIRLERARPNSGTILYTIVAQVKRHICAHARVLALCFLWHEGNGSVNAWFGHRFFRVRRLSDFTEQSGEQRTLS